jgi:hypothetical protein
MHLVEHQNDLFSCQKIWTSYGAGSNTYSGRSIMGGGGVLLHWWGTIIHTQQINTVPSLCQMPESATTYPKWVGVVQSQVPSRSAESVLSVFPMGIKTVLGLAWNICPFQTHMHSYHYGRVQRDHPDPICVGHSPCLESGPLHHSLPHVLQG